MATVKPFKAIRPSADKVTHVASRSYEEYGEDELRAALSFNPFSFLHIINPGFKYDHTISGKERFKLVLHRYEEFLEDDIFIKDDAACFYLYKITAGSFSSQGLFCATSIADYRANIIKKHEATISSREKVFAKYLKTVGFNAEPVLMTYKENTAIESLLQAESQKAPLYHFTSTDRREHHLWKIDTPEIIEALQLEFSKMDSLYIADGHHRSASSHVLAQQLEKENEQHSGEEPYNFFMSYLLPESEIKIYGFNRTVKDLNGLSKEEFLIQLDKYFRIEKKEEEFFEPKQKHVFGMYLDGDFYALMLRKKQYPFTDALSELDPQILYKAILEPILGITDLRNDTRITYGSGKYNIVAMKAAIDAKKYAVGFSILPLNINEVKAIADANLVMPPKSTYIEPKLRSGLTIYEL